MNNYELTDEEKAQCERDLAFINEQFDLFGKEIEIPSAIYSENLMYLIEEETAEAEASEKSTDNVIKLKQHIWKKPMAYAAMFALVFGIYYVSGIDNTPDITNAPTPTPLMADSGPTPRSAGIAPIDDVYASDYKELRLVIGELQKEQEIRIENSDDNSGMSSSALAAPATPAAPPNGGIGGREESGKLNNNTSSPAEDMSSTNVQVDGIDEADIVKTDGKNLYVYSRDMETQTAQIAIVEAETMAKISSIDITGDRNLHAGNDMEMYLVDDRLVLLSSVADRIIPMAKEILLKPISNITGKLFADFNKIAASGSSPSGFAPSVVEGRMAPDYYGYDNQVASAVIYDVSDNTNPTEVRRFEQDGDYVSSRVHEGTLYVVTSKQTYVDVRDDNMLLSDLVPMIGDSVIGTSMAIPATSVALMPTICTPTYAVVSALDISNDTAPATTKAILGAADEIYMSENSIYITGNNRNNMRNTENGSYSTDIIKMSVDGLNVKYKATANVPGYIDNQFALDEHKGNFRIATTSYKNSTTQNNLYILDENLMQLGYIEGLAPGERIYSARYMGDMAYIVTFRETDPLFAIDLSDPKNPKVLGELKIPGFSEYMHPIDENTLIGFGVNTEVDKNGNVRQNGLKLSMFDVTDPKNPKESNVFYLGNQGSQSEVLYNHKAFMYNEKRDLIGFPVTIQTEITGTDVKDEWSRQYKTSFSGYMLMTVDKDTGFKTVVNIPSTGDANMSRWYMDESSIRRGVYIGNKLYTTSFDKVMEYSLDTNEKLRETKI